MAAPGRVGVIADDTLQGHLLAGAIKGQGYQVVVNTDPEHLEARWLAADAPPPARTADHYPRWERRLMTKLVGYIGAPALEENLAAVPQAPLAAPIPEPREFRTLAGGTLAQRVWVLGASLGGPAAVKQFLDCLPEHLPVAFVLAQHIDGGFLDTLCQVLRRDSPFHCQVAGDGDRLGHGRVLVAPANPGKAPTRPASTR